MLLGFAKLERVKNPDARKDGTKRHPIATPVPSQNEAKAVPNQTTDCGTLGNGSKQPLFYHRIRRTFQLCDYLDQNPFAQQNETRRCD